MAMGAETRPNQGTGMPPGREERTLRMISAICLAAGAILLVASLALPYWSVVLRAPQYPDGLRVTTYVTKMTGDVAEIDELNHYIGMMKLGDAARLERAAAVIFLPAAAVLLLASWFVRSGWAVWLMRAPGIIFPFGVLIDLQVWLWYAGHHLDPKAALSSSIKAFTPRMIGPGVIGQFKTFGMFDAGFWLAAAAALLVIWTLFLPSGPVAARRRSS